MGEELACQSESTLLPHWVPDAAERYLLHTEIGLSIRAVARDAGCHASTVLRQIRRFENRRDDILIDQALRSLGEVYYIKKHREDEINPELAIPRRNQVQTDYDIELHREALRVLRRLCESGASLVAAGDMDKAVVLRDLPGGKSARTVIVERSIAEAMALKEWIKCKKNGKISQYEATVSGKSFLKSSLRNGGNSGEGTQGFDEAPAVFSGAPVAWGNAKNDERPVTCAPSFLQFARSP